MRVAALALVGALACACGPLHEEGCARPCPPACASSCLPSGYCADARLDLPDTVRGPLTSLDLAVPGLPPDAPVAVALHAVLDFPARGRTLPWDYWFKLYRVLAPPDTSTSVLAIEVSGYNAVAFPVAAAWTGAARSDAAGIVRLVFEVDQCYDRGGGTDSRCELLPGTFLTASLLDPTPWKTAPACP